MVVVSYYELVEWMVVVRQMAFVVVAVAVVVAVVVVVVEVSVAALHKQHS